MEPPRARIAATLVIGLGWLVFALLYLAFYTGGFSFFQNIAILLVSLVVVVALLGLMWVGYGLKQARMEHPHGESFEPEIPSSGKAVATIIIGSGWLVFVLLFLAFCTGDFSFFQNVAILLVSVVAVTAVLGLLWVRWGLRQTRAAGIQMPIWRSVATVIAFLVWLVLVLYFLAFYTGGFSFFQNIAILLVSIIVLAGVMASLWVGWSFRQAERLERRKK